MTRAEFADAVRRLLTDEQRAEIMRLHDQLEPQGWLEGCVAHGEGDDCCVDLLVGEKWIEQR